MQFERQTTVSAAAEPLLAFVEGAAFQRASANDKYLTVLSWIACNQPADFSEFVRSEPSAQPLKLLAGPDVLAKCRSHQSRQLGATQYWAIMDISLAMKRRFLVTMLEFIGYRPDVTTRVCSRIFEN